MRKSNWWRKQKLFKRSGKSGWKFDKEQERQFNRYTDKIKSINESIDEELLISEPLSQY